MTTQNTPVVLVISTGAQDIKRWIGWTDRKSSADKVAAQPLPKFDCRKWHGHLWPQPDQPKTFRARLVRDFPPEGDNLRSVTIAQLAEDPIWADLLRDDITRGKGSDRLYWQDDKLLLHPAKITGLLDALDAGAGDLEVRRVVVLYSDRPDWRDAKSEPFRNGPALGHWLADELGIPARGETSFDGAEPGIVWVNYLEGLTLYEGQLHSPDFPLRTKAVHAIDSAIANAAASLDGAYAIYSTRGGFDEVKPIIAGACDLHFEGRVFCHWETEHKELLNPEVPETIDLARLRNQATYAIPAETLPARARAAARLREGDILGAWGALAHLDSIEHDRDWLDAVQDLAAYFRNEAPSTSVLRAIELGPDDECGPLLLRAFQVEAALQGERASDRRIPEALLATAAIRDLAQDVGIRMGFRALGLPIEDGRFGVPEAEVNQARQRIEACLKDTRKTPNWDSRELIKDDGRINTRGTAELMRHLLCVMPLAPPLNDLGRALTDLHRFLEHGNEVQPALSTLRNHLAHRALSEGDAARVIARARSADPKHLGPLWQLSADDHAATPVLGSIFLTAPLIVRLFAAFGIRDPAARYRHLMRQTITALREPIQVAQ